MNLEKAIEILESKAAFPYNHPSSDEYKARKMGIEALKRILSGRNPERRYVCYLLLGETED